MGGGQLRWSIADSARGVEALRALRAEGKGVEKDPPRCAACSQSLEQLKVRTATCTATAPTDHPRHGPLITGQRGGHGHGRGQSWGWGSEQTFRGGLAAGRGVRDRGGGAVAVEAAGGRVCMWGLGLGGGLCVRPPAPPAVQGFVLSLDAGAAGQGRRGDYALQLLDHSPAVVHPPPPLPSGRGFSPPTLLTSSPTVFLFQSVAVSPLVPLCLFLLLPLAFARQVRGGWHALLCMTELLQPATGFRRSALGFGPQQALPPVLWWDGGGSEFVSAFSVGFTLPHWGLRWLRTWGGREILMIGRGSGGFGGVVGRYSGECMLSYLGPVGSCWWGASWPEAALLSRSPVAAAGPGECRAAPFDWTDGVTDGCKNGGREGEKKGGHKHKWSSTT